MSALNHVTSRHSPPHVRKSALAKTARSALATSCKLASKTSKHRKPILRKGKDREEEEGEEEQKEDCDSLLDDQDCQMATSFLQYCATCEKQIFVPDASVLYCSEQCRGIDALPPADAPHRLLAQSFPPKAHGQPSGVPSPFSLSLPRYVPSLQPTPRPRKTARIPSIEHNGNIDLDPTEWKPAEPLDDDHNHDMETSRVAHPNADGRERSDALLYLSKFHRTGGYSSASKHQQASRGPPSLSRTSTTTASSLSSSGASSLCATPYSLVSPPPVSVPTTTITKAGSNSSDQVATLSLVDGLSYQKKAVKPGSTGAAGSLKRLLGSVNQERSSSDVGESDKM